jgi:hypothetical protein
LAALYLLAVPGWSAAQSPCTPEMSLQDCWAAFNNASAARAASEVESAVESATDTINTGSQTGADTATDDFNPRLQVSADTTGVTGDDGGGLTLSWADILLGSDRAADSTGQHHKLIVKLQDAQLFEPLKNLITDPAQREELEESLDDFDDVLVDFRLGLDSRKYGRDINRQPDLIRAIQSAAQAPLESLIDEMILNTDREDELRQKLQAAHPNFAADKPMNAELAGGDRLDDNEINSLIAAATAANDSTREYARRYEISARENGLYDLVDLVNNQPQLTLAIEGRLRGDLAGPDENALKFSYEHGRVNVNAFRKYEAERRSGETPAVVKDVARRVAASARLAAAADPRAAKAAASAVNNAALAAAGSGANEQQRAAIFVGARAIADAAEAASNATPEDAGAVASAAETAANAVAARIDAQPCATTVSCLKAYVAENRDRMRAGDRFAVSVAFVRKDGFHYDQGVTLDLPSEESLVAQLSYGRYLGTRRLDGPLGGRRSRLDLTASFEDVKGDPARHNRALANVTFAQEINPGLFLTVGLVWANKPEYRGTVEEELSARAGISYKLAPE